MKMTFGSFYAFSVVLIGGAAIGSEPEIKSEFASEIASVGEGATSIIEDTNLSAAQKDLKRKIEQERLEEKNKADMEEYYTLLWMQ